MCHDSAGHCHMQGNDERPWRVTVDLCIALVATLKPGRVLASYRRNNTVRREVGSGGRRLRLRRLRAAGIDDAGSHTTGGGIRSSDLRIRCDQLGIMRSIGGYRRRRHEGSRGRTVWGTGDNENSSHGSSERDARRDHHICAPRPRRPSRQAYAATQRCPARDRPGCRCAGCCLHRVRRQRPNEVRTAARSKLPLNMLHGLRSVVWIFGKHPRDQLIELVRNGWDELARGWYRGELMLHEQLAGRTIEWHPPTDQFVQDAAKRIDVCSMVDVGRRSTLFR